MGGVAPSPGTFVGVLPSDAGARIRLGSVPLGGLPGVVPTLVGMALNACKITPWPQRSIVPSWGGIVGPCRTISPI